MLFGILGKKLSRDVIPHVRFLDPEIYQKLLRGFMIVILIRYDIVVFGSFFWRKENIQNILLIRRNPAAIHKLYDRGFPH